MSRPSHVRNAISALIATSARHDWAIDDVVDGLRRQGISADYSSVFRGLAHLEECGEIHGVDLGDGKLRYESRSEHHEHIRCDSCGVVAAVPGCSVRSVHSTVEADTGYLVTGHHVRFSGVCPDCSNRIQS